jgi:hypothetical protein
MENQQKLNGRITRAGDSRYTPKIWAPTYEVLYRMWAVERLTLKQIAARHHVTIRAVSQKLEKHKIRDIKPRKSWCTREELWQDFVVDYLSAEKIAEKYNVGVATVRDKLRIFGITARDRTGRPNLLLVARLPAQERTQDGRWSQGTDLEGRTEREI